MHMGSMEITTIVTCMTDGERPFLADSLRSVRDQTVPSKIILCVAENNTWVDDILFNVQADIELMRLEFAWASAIRNQAIAAVKTELVAFLDGDDLWRPTKLRRQVDALRARQLDVVASKHILIREDDSKPFFFGFAKNLPMTSSWLGKTAAFSERPFELVPVSEDVFLWERLESEVRCEIMKDFLIRYRVREKSLSSMTPTKERKLKYARWSQHAGVRPLLLSTSYLANVGLQARGRL